METAFMLHFQVALRPPAVRPLGKANLLRCGSIGSGSYTGWEDVLRSFLEGAQRVLLLGIGNCLRGDDGAGTHVAELVGRVCRRREPKVACLAVPGGPAPENFTGTMRRFCPDKVILVDAVSAGLPAGRISVLRREDLAGVSLSSHTMPLGVLSDYLSKAGFGEQLTLGIQPARIDFGCTMSNEVRTASLNVARAVLQALS